jgi:hypothetical protein
MQHEASQPFLRTPNWNWLEDGLLPLILAGMRTCWLWPWLALIGRVLAPGEPEAVLPAWMILLLPLLSLTLARQWTQSNRNAPGVSSAIQLAIPWSARIGVAVSGLIATLLVLWWQIYRPEFSLLDAQWLSLLGDALIHWPANRIPAPVLVAVYTLGLWMTGLRDAPKKFVHDDVWRAFGAGVTAVALYVILVRLGGAELPAYLGTNVLWLLGLGMTGLAFTSLKITAGLDRALGAGPRRTAATPGISLHWLGSVITVIGGLLLAGLLMGVLIAPEMLAGILQAGSTVLAFIGRLVAFVLLGIAYGLVVIGYYIALWLAPLFQRLFGERFAEFQELALLEQEQETVREMQDVAAAPVPDTYRWIGVIVITLLVALAFALALRRLSALNREESDETRDSVLSAELLQDQLGALWQNLRRRWRTAAQASPFLSLDGESGARRRIRLAYQQLLGAAGAAGQSRAPDWTPHEFAQQLGAHPALADAAEQTALHELTESYLQARYAAEAPSAQAADRAQDASNRLENRLHPEETAADDEIA